MSLERRFDDANLLDSTRGTYTRILTRMADSRAEPVEWARTQLKGRRPMGTLLPIRAAVTHYLVAEEGMSEDEVRALLPRVRGLDPGPRHALTPDQLAVYYTAVRRVPDPIRTLLLLLPRTGLRISEACALRPQDVVTSKGEPYLLVAKGKGQKARSVPLTDAALAVLTKYAETYKPGRWLFKGQKDGPITAQAVRKVTRRLAAEHDELRNLSPHVLRHTFATLALARGMQLPYLQAILGHEKPETTSIYLHPTTADLAAAMRKLDD